MIISAELVLTTAHCWTHAPFLPRLKQSTCESAAAVACCCSLCNRPDGGTDGGSSLYWNTEQCTCWNFFFFFFLSACHLFCTFSANICVRLHFCGSRVDSPCTCAIAFMCERAMACVSVCSSISADRLRALRPLLGFLICMFAVSLRDHNKMSPECILRARRVYHRCPVSSGFTWNIFPEHVDNLSSPPSFSSHSFSCLHPNFVPLLCFPYLLYTSGLLDSQHTMRMFDSCSLNEIGTCWSISHLMVRHVFSGVSLHISDPKDCQLYHCVLTYISQLTCASDSSRQPEACTHFNYAVTLRPCR